MSCSPSPPRVRERIPRHENEFHRYRASKSCRRRRRVVKDYLRFDAKTPHLAVRVSAESKYFVFQKRLEGGGQYRTTLGRFPALTAAKATQAAKVLAGKIAAGDDLLAERAARKAKRDRAQAHGAFTLERFISEWETAAPKSELRPGYVKATAGGLRRVYAKLLDQPATSISAGQLEDGWKSLADDLPAAARAARTRVRTLYSWGVKTWRIEHDPTGRTVLETKPKKPRQVFLTGDEARKVWEAAGRIAPPYGPAIRLLLATAVRLREATGARWSEFNTDLSEWTIAGDRMKVGEPHVVWLPPPVREMLAGLPQFAGSDLVFTNGKREIAGFTALKRKLDKALEGSGVKEFTFHDFRRSVTTWLVRAKVADSIVADRLLAHTKLAGVSAVASTYNIYDFETERRVALERWVDFLVGGEAETSASAPLMLPAPSPTSATLARSGREARHPRRSFTVRVVKDRKRRRRSGGGDSLTYFTDHESTWT